MSGSVTIITLASNAGWAPKEANTSHIYLPEGWKCFAIKRSSGLNKGMHDIVYLS